MFKSLKAVDVELLLSEEIYLSDLEENELEKYFQLSNFRLVTNKTSYGPFGCSDSPLRKPVAVPIENGNVLAQAMSSFIYPNDDDEPVHYSNSKCFSFYVSAQYERTRIRAYSLFQPKIRSTFLCWLKRSNDTEQDVSVQKVPVMFMQLKNNTACFYNDSHLKSMEFNFKFKRYCFPSTNETLCFEADITTELRYSLQKHGVIIDDQESKLYFALMANGNLGRVLYYSERSSPALFY